MLSRSRSVHGVALSAFSVFSLLSLLIGAAPACVIASPDFDGESSASVAGSTTGSTIGSTTGSTIGDVTGSTTGSVTAEPSTTSTSSTGDPESSSSSSSTTGVEPGTYTLAPTVATCVFLAYDNAPYNKPKCSANASAQNGKGLSGMMMIDTVVVEGDGQSRRAESYLRFDIPPEFAGLTVVEATLAIQNGNTYDGDAAGHLFRTESFTEASLETQTPAHLGELADPRGFVGVSEWVTWQIPPEHVVAGQPTSLGLLPTDSFAVFYRGKNTEPGSPYLEVVLQ